ncbi:hypothetical protein VPH35_001210 [Triticum aestivum]
MHSSFIVDGETFHAHRAVLAAHSPAFRAELFNSMSKATMSSITLHDITPETFKVMLWFIYTDELPMEDEHEDSSTEMFQDLFAAADQKVSVDIVATILASAETYNCQELKNKCIDFFVVEENCKKAMFTYGYVLMVLKSIEIIVELKNRI